MVTLGVLQPNYTTRKNNKAQGNVQENQKEKNSLLYNQEQNRVTTTAGENQNPRQIRAFYPKHRPGFK